MDNQNTNQNYQQYNSQSPAPIKTKRSKAWVVFAAIAILAAVLAGAGAWQFQQNKINDLHSKNGELEDKIAKAEEQEQDSQFEISEEDRKSAEGRVKDTERETDIKTLHGYVETYYADNGYYPSLSELNDSEFRSADIPGLDDETLKAPGSDKSVLVDSASEDAYSYSTTPAGCDNELDNRCKGYIMTATLANGSAYSKKSLN